MLYNTSGSIDKSVIKGLRYIKYLKNHIKTQTDEKEFLINQAPKL